MATPVASTRNPFAFTGTTGGTQFPAATPSWTSDVGEFAIPGTNLGTTSAAQMVSDPLQATVSAAPALQRVADIVSSINQRAWMSAPGRQEELANIQRWQSGELDPSIYAQEATQAAQTYGGGGFGVDSPAWQAAIQRALVTNRQALQEKGAAALGQFYEGMPTTDVTRFTLTPSDYAAAMDAQRGKQLALAELQQKGALTTAELAQNRALAEQELALKREQYQQDIALREQELQFRRDAQAAALAEKGLTMGGTPISSPERHYWDWMEQGYSRPTTYTELPVYTMPRRRT